MQFGLNPLTPRGGMHYSQHIKDICNPMPSLRGATSSLVLFIYPEVFALLPERHLRLNYSEALVLPAR
jgi:hypothetical protein